MIAVILILVGAIALNFYNQNLIAEEISSSAIKITKVERISFLPKKYKITLENGEVLKLKGRYSKRGGKYTPKKGMSLYPKSKEEVILENKGGYKFKLKIDS